MSKEKLSAKQIKNWRKILCRMFGPYALMIPEEEVQSIRDKMQNKAESFPLD
jgi:hypothetical protein